MKHPPPPGLSAPDPEEVVRGMVTVPAASPFWLSTVIMVFPGTMPALNTKAMLPLDISTSAVVA